MIEFTLRLIVAVLETYIIIWLILQLSKEYRKYEIYKIKQRNKSESTLKEEEN
jgi:hypothetical protein|tara:strand:- start:201 stop:359 length:159 start_codon:yes stop_codon:yes gene_type:complete